jgi:hypothetical protein
MNNVLCLIVMILMVLTGSGKGDQRDNLPKATEKPKNLPPKIGMSTSRLSLTSS